MDITIIGAGLCGSLLALRMAQRGHNVFLFEKRPDMRKAKMSAGRSINLALSDRGIAALKMVGMEEEMLALAVPMHGRMIHPLQGEPMMARYSGRQGEYINSISRGALNMALLDKLETFPNVKLYFEYNCLNVNSKTSEATFDNVRDNQLSIKKSNIVIGTDGTNSALRDSMMKDKSFMFNYSQDYLSHGYKELNIPPETSGVLEKNALHIWPRGEFMMIALPNPEGDFTATIFMSYVGKVSFDKIKSKEDLFAFFEQYFPDVLPLIPDLEAQYFKNPVGQLVTVRCFPWQRMGNTLLMGDAAHAIVPFYGQGMNCSFEDVVVFDKLLDYFSNNTEALFQTFEIERKQNSDAIADLAVDNFYEMRDHTANPIFQKKRQLETKLEQTFPDYFSKYSLVTFREDVPYHEALARGRKQDELLMSICEKTEDISQLDLESIKNQLNF